MSVYNNYVTIDKSCVNDALTWAKENCPTYITNDWHMTGYNVWDDQKIDFFFTTTNQGMAEMTAFALKWA